MNNSDFNNQLNSNNNQPNVNDYPNTMQNNMNNPNYFVNNQPPINSNPNEVNNNQSNVNNIPNNMDNSQNNIRNPFLNLQPSTNNNQNEINNNQLNVNNIPNNMENNQNNINNSNYFVNNQQSINNNQSNINNNSNIMENVVIPNTNVNNQQPINNNLPNINNSSNANSKKTKKHKKNGKKIILYIFFSLVIVVSGVIYYLESQKKEPEQPAIYDPLPSEIIIEDNQKIDATIEASSIRLAPDVDLEHERQYYNNPEIVGRLEIPDLFNVLVAQSSDNEYYLYKSIYRKNDIRGTEFLDHRVTPTSKQVNIYGHNTRDLNIKVAFLKLEKFIDAEFFDNNQYIVFQFDGGKRVYKIMALQEIRQNDNEHMYVDYTGQEFVDHVTKMISGEGLIHRRNIHFDEDSEIIVLQTCSHHWDNGFYIITAVKILDLY